MTIHRCDVCRTEFTAQGQVVRVEVRVNLYALAGDKDPNFVLVGQDVCAKPACRVTGLRQLCDAGFLQALEHAGLKTSDAHAPGPKAV